MLLQSGSVVQSLKVINVDTDDDSRKLIYYFLVLMNNSCDRISISYTDRIIVNLFHLLLFKKLTC